MYSCCKSMSHRRVEGGVRRNRGGCCRYCIENNRYAIFVQKARMPFLLLRFLHIPYMDMGYPPAPSAILVVTRATPS